MGTFSNVEPHPSLLPEGYREFAYWQTKDVICPMATTLVIKESGQLLHRWSGLLRNRYKLYDEELDYTGKMYFYTITTPYSGLITLVAEFVDGKLISIEEVGDGLQ